MRCQASSPSRASVTVAPSCSSRRENRSRTSGSSSATSTRRPASGRDSTTGAAAGPVRAQLDPAAVLLNDPVRHRKTEAGSLPRLLRREERIEDAVPQLERHARTVVLDLEHDLVASAAGANDDAPRPMSRGDRLLGVVDEIEHDLLELVEVEAGRRKRLGEL